jgi:glycosyltransferase involved in cell wall biosynthesis
MHPETLCYNTAMQPTNIGLNAQLLSLKQSYRGAGISWYIYNLLQNLPTVSPEFFSYNVFLADPEYSTGANNIRLHPTPLPTSNPFVRIFWEQFIQPLRLQQSGVDLLHALAFVAPVVCPTPFVVTVFDLSFLRFPQAFRPFNRWYLRHFTTHTSKRASAVITISESTRRDTIKLLNVPPEKVHTIYCGVDNDFKPMPAATVAAFRKSKSLPDKFILFLGTLEPRKNVDGLIEAYAQWHTQDRQALPLIIAGGKGWYYQHIFQQVEALDLTDSIHFPGYIPQEELPLWYNAATVFVYPSRFEGFGLPVLEAMACGTPVITSTAASLPEVAGTDGTARLIPPEDHKALADALAEVSSTPALQADMSRRGLVRATKFNWQSTARETVGIYQKVLAE